MLKSIFQRKILWALFGVAGPALVAFAASPILARGLGPAARGQFAASIAVLGLAAFLADLGLSNGLMVAAARSGAVNPQVFGLAIWTYLGSATATAMCLVILRELDIAHFSWWIILGIPVILTGNLLRAPITASGNTMILAIERWAQSVSRLAFLAVFAFAGLLTHDLATFAHIASLAVCLLVPAFGWRGIKKNHEELDFNLRRFGLATWSVGLSSVVLVRLDQLVLLPVAGARQLGIYAVAAGLGEVPLLISAALRMTYEGRIAGSRSARPMALPLFGALALGVLITSISVVAGPWIVSLLYGDSFKTAAPIFTILLAASVPAMVVDMCGSSLIALGRPGAQWRAATLAAIVTLILLYPLAHRYGALGAAYVTLISYVVAAGACFFELCRHEPKWWLARREESSGGEVRCSVPENV